jgi:catechol 2,3-dioxygenase-like lactoylglutathione lyase family enzyme
MPSSCSSRATRRCAAAVGNGANSVIAPLLSISRSLADTGAPSTTRSPFHNNIFAINRLRLLDAASTRSDHAEKSTTEVVMEIHRGRLLDHVQLLAADLKRSRDFYKAVLPTLGFALTDDADDHFSFDELYVSPADQGREISHVHIAFQAASRAVVDEFHKAALAAGATDNGAPGERAYHPGYYAAFVLDPDGNNIEAVYHGQSQRSAESVLIKADDPRGNS